MPGGYNASASAPSRLICRFYFIYGNIFDPSTGEAISAEAGRGLQNIEKAPICSCEKLVGWVAKRELISNIELKASPEGEAGEAVTRVAPALGGPGQPIFRKPDVDDGVRVSRLIAGSPPLDANSAYCTLLQCTDFAETCVLAEREGEPIGWVSAYRRPAEPECLFVWQVAVATSARGEGLAGKMLDELLARPAAAGVNALATTITASNAASWRLFETFARRHGASLGRSLRFNRETHFAGAHDSEWEVRIAPLQTHSD